MSLLDNIKGLFKKKEENVTFDVVMNHSKDISDETLNLILDKATKGSIEYSLLAGILYLKGERVEQNAIKALDFLDKASRAGSLKAQKILAKEYLSGSIIPQDFQVAFELFQKAAYGGDTESTYNLGLMYLKGLFIERDINRALECFQKAADTGYTKAKIAIADVYYLDEPDVPTDRTKACRIYKEVLSSDSETVNVGQLYLNLGKAYTESALPSGVSKEEGIYYLKKAIEKEYYEAIRLLALIGDQLEETDQKWLFEAASKNKDNNLCIFAKGICHEYGYGTLQDINEAFGSYKRAANFGDPWAKHYTASVYLRNKMTPEITQEWIHLETQAAANGVHPAQFSLGICYLHGDKVEQDQNKALELLNQAAKNHNADAIKVLEELKEIEDLKNIAQTQNNSVSKLKDNHPTTPTY